MLNKSTHRIIVSISLIIMSYSGHARSAAEWEIGLGFGSISLPYYRGTSSTMDLTTLFPYLRYRSEKLTIDEEGMHGKLFAHNRLSLDISLAAGIPVPSNKNPLRTGMPELDTGFEAGPEFEFLLARNTMKKTTLRIAVPVRAAFSVDSNGINHIGWITSPYIELRKTIFRPGGWQLAMAWGPMFADRRYHDYYYGVDSLYVTPARPFYQAVSGDNGTRLTMTITRRYKRYWLGAFIRHDWLGNTAFDDSPLVDSRHYQAAGIGIAVILSQSDQNKRNLFSAKK